MLRLEGCYRKNAHSTDGFASAPPPPEVVIRHLASQRLRPSKSSSEILQLTRELLCPLQYPILRRSPSGSVLSEVLQGDLRLPQVRGPLLIHTFSENSAEEGLIVSLLHTL